jgi:hypothetical protein
MEKSPGGKIANVDTMRVADAQTGWKNRRMENRQRGPMRVADAQTGRPYRNHFENNE